MGLTLHNFHSFIFISFPPPHPPSLFLSLTFPSSVFMVLFVSLSLFFSFPLLISSLSPSSAVLCVCTVDPLHLLHLSFSLSLHPLFFSSSWFLTFSSLLLITSPPLSLLPLFSLSFLPLHLQFSPLFLCCWLSSFTASVCLFLSPSFSPTSIFLFPLISHFLFADYISLSLFLSCFFPFLCCSLSVSLAVDPLPLLHLSIYMSLSLPLSLFFPFCCFPFYFSSPWHSFLSVLLSSPHLYLSKNKSGHEKIWLLSYFSMLFSTSL